MIEEQFIQPLRQDLPNEVSYMRAAIPNWREVIQKPVNKGEVAMLIICPSAIRSCNLNRLLEPFKTKKCATVKLFSRHMKIEQQKESLKKRGFHVGIGTPSRIYQLIQEQRFENHSLLF